MLPSERRQPVVRAASLCLAHVPGLVFHGSKAERDLRHDPELAAKLQARLRDFDQFVAYPPNQVFVGNRHPDELAGLPRPWFHVADEAARPTGRDGRIVDEVAFYGLLKQADQFDLVALDEDLAARAGAALETLGWRQDGTAITGAPRERFEAEIAQGTARPLYLRDGSVAGSIRHAHDEDVDLRAEVLLENLAAKASAVMALRCLFELTPEIAPTQVEYLIGTGEEAVGDRYQRGGGNLAKAVAESCGCLNATGSDTKAFCAAPVHAMMIAGALVSSGLADSVAVVGGGSLTKLGMKLRGHLAKEMPILEDALASLAVLITPDDGRSPIIRLDAVGRHAVNAGSAQQAILDRLVFDPLAHLGLSLHDVDKYATELQNPEITEPAGSGNVPRNNYRIIGSLGIMKGQLAPADLEGFTQQHGMMGYSPTQGHIASAVPFVGHALRGLTGGTYRRVMFLAKGSLFLGRMTQLSDGLSLLLERNPALG